VITNEKMNVIDALIEYLDKKGLEKIQAETHITWSNEFVEYRLETNNFDDFVLSCYSIEILSRPIFLFNIPEKESDLLILLRILDEDVS
jgi:hypothetical protein